MSTTTPTSSDKLPEIQTEAGAAPVLPPLPTVDPSVQPTVGEDLERLRQIDCLKATIVRWKTGTHPDTVIEQVLARRLSLEESRFLTPFPLRVLTALALVFAGCAGAWGGLWFVCWQLGFTDYLLNLSIWMSFLLVGLGVFVLWHPGRAYDETALAKEIRERLQQLEKDAGTGTPASTPAQTRSEPAKTES